MKIPRLTNIRRLAKSFSPAKRDVILRHAMKHVRSQAIREGTWFTELILAHINRLQERLANGTFDARHAHLPPDERRKRIIAEDSWHAATAGALGATGSNAGGILSLVTDGLAAPVGIPAAALSMIAEAAYTALVHVNLVCELATIYGVPFHADEQDDVVSIFSVALGVEQDATPTQKPRVKKKGSPAELLAGVITSDEKDVGKRVGNQLLEESVMRNIGPLVGMVVSARWNYQATKRIGASAMAHIAKRRVDAHLKAQP